MRSHECVLSDEKVADMVMKWDTYHDCKTIRDLSIDLKNERQYSRKLEMKLELMTHHRNRLLDKSEGHRDE